jgi:hypothetical protein
MYIGNDLQIAHPSYKIIDDISSGFNGSTTSFALQVSGATPVPFPISTQQVMISVNGVVQEPDPNGGAGFKLLGSNIVFSSAPANGHAFFGVINAGADYVTAGSEFPDGSATAPSFTFQDDQDTGWFRSGSGAVGFSANGVNTIGFDGNGLTVTGDATFTGDSSKNMFWDKSDGQLEFADDSKAVFGTGSDLELFHNATNSHVRNQTGDLIIDSNSSGSVKIRPKIGEEGIVCETDGPVTLYNNGSAKLATSATGATLTGTLVADGLTVDTNTLHVDATNNRVGIGDASPDSTLHISRSASTAYDPTDDNAQRSDGASLTIENSDGTTNSFAQIAFDTAGSNQSIARIVALRTGTSSNALTFVTEHSNTKAERMRIDSSGRLLLGTTTEGNGDSDDLTIATSGRTGITIRSSTSEYGNIFFSDGTSGADEYRGSIQYYHSNNSLILKSNAVDALTLDSSQNATFAGSAVINGDPTNGVNQGIELSVSGYIEVCNTQDNYYVWKGFKKGSGGGNGTLTSSVLVDGTATFAGTVSDSKGNLRSIPRNNQSSAYTLVAADAGKCITAAGNITVNNSVFAEGDAVTIIADTGSTVSIVQGSGVTMYNTGDASTGSKTLAARGMCTIWFVAANNCYLSGAGLS